MGSVEQSILRCLGYVKRIKEARLTKRIYRAEVNVIRRKNDEK